MPGGRPTKYSKKITSLICEGVACGISMRTICKDDGLPCIATVFNWLAKHDEFLDHYTRAKEQGCIAMAEDIMSIADDGQNDYMEKLASNGEADGFKTNGEAINRSRLRVDARKWLMSKTMPKKYGDKLATEMSGPNGGPIGVKDYSNYTDDELEAIAKKEGV